MNAKYQIVLLNRAGEIIGERPADTMKQAIAEARYMMSEEYALRTESTHTETDKVEVRNAAGECVYDIFR